MIDIYLGEPFVKILPGSFVMGSDQGLPIELPVHRVNIEKGFYLGARPVTQKLWQDVMGDNPSCFRTDDLLPVENITWHSACSFCSEFELLIGKTVRLPTEAEWEYSCRAGSTSEYYWGDESKFALDYAWFELNSMDSTQLVGLKKPNDWGLYDMAGNVWEWCLDSWVSDYSEESQIRKSLNKSERRVIRGGAWDMDVFRCRSAYRSNEGELIATKKIGFRVLIEEL